MDISEITELLPFLIPILLIELALLVIAVVDIAKREHVRGGNKIVWILIIVLINIIGPIIYLALGRQDKPDDSD